MNDKGDAPSQLKIAGVQATGGIIAGAVTSFVTTPIDTIKTRLQVLFHILTGFMLCATFFQAYPFATAS